LGAWVGVWWLVAVLSRVADVLLLILLELVDASSLEGFEPFVLLALELEKTSSL
jgi:hypothetical protein